VQEETRGGTAKHAKYAKEKEKERKEAFCPSGASSPAEETARQHLAEEEF
jgi:hypothetical protein